MVLPLLPAKLKYKFLKHTIITMNAILKKYDLNVNVYVLKDCHSLIYMFLISLKFFPKYDNFSNLLIFMFTFQ